MKHGCNNCKWCKCYKGDYWTPDEYECQGGYDIPEDVMQRVWENGEEWSDNEEPICPAYEEAPTEDDEYWEKYAYEERYAEK